MGYARVMPLWLVHLLAAVPSQAMGQCDFDGLGEAECPAAGIASELLQREVLTREGKQKIIQSEADWSVTRRRRRRGGSQNSGKGPIIEMKPYVCNRSSALRITTSPVGTIFQELEVESGSWKNIRFHRNIQGRQGPRRINSCAINPLDKIVYCNAGFRAGAFLARVDMSSQVAFVARMPRRRYAATFDKDGNFWMYGDTGLSVIKDVSSMPSYTDWSKLEGNRGFPPHSIPVKMTLGADLAVMYGDLDGSGSEGTYLVSLTKGTLHVVKVSQGKNILNKYKHWELFKTSGLPAWVATWGAAWSYGNFIFFAANSGEGVYRLDDLSVNIQNASASFMYMGPAQGSVWGNGLSCVAKGTPWEPIMVPYPHCGSGKALQAATTNLTVPTNPTSKTHLRFLDIPTGTYKPYFEVQKNWTDPPFNSINSCAINPLDSIIYCTMEIDNKGSFLVRIDSTKVGYVTKVPGWMYSGVFDGNGTYYMYGSVGLSFITEVAGMPTYGKVCQLGDTPLYNGPHKIERTGADIAFLEANLEGTGMETYLLSVEGHTLDVIRASPNRPPDQWKLFRVDDLQGDFPYMANVWGSAWNFQEKVYFASDSGAGIYELQTNSIVLENRTAKFKKVGKSQISTWNDGFSCIGDTSPFEA